MDTDSTKVKIDVIKPLINKTLRRAWENIFEQMSQTKGGISLVAIRAQSI